MDRIVAVPKKTSDVKFRPLQDKTEVKDFFDFSSNTFIRQVSYERVVVEESGSNKINHIKMFQTCILAANKDIPALNQQKKKSDKCLALKNVDKAGTTQHCRSLSSLSRLIFCRRTLLFLFYIASIFCVGYILKQSVLYQQECHKHFDTDKARKYLVSKIHGQEQAVLGLLNAMSLYINSDSTQSNIIAMLGNSGVGKSYTVELLTNFFPWKSNIHYLKLHAHRMESSEIKKTLSYCGSNFIIIDDLNIGTVNMALDFTNSLLHYAKEINFKMIVLLVITDNRHYNLYNTEIKRHELEDLLKASTVPVEFITFEDLSLESIKQCINDSLSNRQITNSEKTEKLILEFLNPTFMSGGCKRIDKKVALFLERNNLVKS